jgi:hypothetical protein
MTMQQAQGSKATVVMLRGYGEDKLRSAIESGLLDAETRKMAERVLTEAQATRRENRILESRNKDLQARQAEYRQIHISAYQEAFNGKRRSRQRGAESPNTITGTGVLAGFVLGATVVAMITTLVILIA